ncbi:hypothetical protein MASSI9I_90057 [Massilia sp. 9I]|nr:hypothetical protein MASSI9I_90057 [Massilia sp. 9I]
METNARVRRPASPLATRRTRSGRAPASCRMRRASGSSALPAAVSATWRRLRRNSGAPSSSSSPAMLCDSGGCVMCRRSAARPKWSSSATVTKWRSWRSSRFIDTRCVWIGAGDMQNISHYTARFIADSGLAALVECLFHAGLAAAVEDIVFLLLVESEHFLDELEPDEGDHHQPDDGPPGQVGETPDFEQAQAAQGGDQEDEGHGRTPYPMHINHKNVAAWKNLTLCEDPPTMQPCYRRNRVYPAMNLATIHGRMHSS